MSVSPRIYIARHCNTKYNLDNRIQGTLDIPLTREGKTQALENIPNLESLGLNRMVSSPLGRAWETAQIYAEYLGVSLQVDQRLRELDHGTWEGERMDMLLNRPGSSYRHWLNDPSSGSIPGSSETVVAAQDRIIACICECAVSFASETVLLITHKHIRALLMCTLRGLQLKHFRDEIEDAVRPTPVPEVWVQRLCGQRCA